MTFDSRARAAVLDIHRAVEVMEMTTSTKEPRTVDRFDRFRDRKQRNRRIGAIIVAGALVVTAIVVVSMNIAGKDEEGIPAAPAELEGRLVYEVYEGGNTSRLYAIDAAGGPVQDLGLSVDPGAHWSPDGTRILVPSGDRRRRRLGLPAARRRRGPHAEPELLRVLAQRDPARV